MSTVDGERQIKPFATALQEIEKGAAALRAGRLLNDLVQAVVATGKKGSVALVVEVAPYKNGNTNNLDVTVRTTAKIPEGDEATASAVFFHDGKGNLRRDDPNQPTLPLRAVDDPERTTA